MSNLPAPEMTRSPDKAFFLSKTSRLLGGKLTSLGPFQDKGQMYLFLQEGARALGMGLLFHPQGLRQHHCPGVREGLTHWH